MVIIFCLVALAPGADADPAVGRGRAIADVIWTHLTGRYPKLQPLEIQLAADEGAPGVRINGRFIALKTPSPAFADLPGVRLIGLAGDRARPWMLLQTADVNSTLIWARYDRAVRRLKFAGANRTVGDPKTFLVTRAYVEAALDEVPATEF